MREAVDAAAADVAAAAAPGSSAQSGPPVVVIAPDSFKGTIRAADAAAAIAEGWRTIRPGDRIVLAPMADGGEGTLDAIAAAVPGAVRVPVEVTGPDDRPVGASWLRLPPSSGRPGGTAVVELASTSGLELLSGALRPWDAHTLGFGQALAAAAAAGVSHLVAAIGSSASTDGGLGMLVALGARAIDAEGRPVRPGARGALQVAGIALDGLVPMPTGGITVLTDVTSPLVGPAGAAAVFGPQKGLDPADVPSVDAALARIAGLLGVDPATPGAGAAGGTGAALLAMGARLLPGAETVAGLVGLAGAIRDARIVVTGEGAFDGQTAAGKAPALVAAIAADAGIPVALVAGVVSAEPVGFAAAVSLAALAGSAAAAMRDPRPWLRAAGAALARDVGA